MASMLDDIKMQYERGGPTVRFIFANVVVFLVLNLIFVPLFLFGIATYPAYAQVLENWLYLPSNLGDLLTHPWTLITYMFLHAGFFHILFNMLILYWFGRILESFTDPRRIYAIYFLSGLVGAVIFILAYNIFPPFIGQPAHMIGASGAVMGVVLAAATLTPYYTMNLILIGPVQLRYIAAVMVLLDVVLMPNNPGGRIAHLGGALTGYLLMSQLQKGTDYMEKTTRLLERIGNFFGSLFNRENRGPRVVHRNTDKKKTETRSKRPGHRSDASSSDQEKVDAILEKIKKSGYNSLSDEEKAFLFRVSKDDQR